MLFFTTYHFTTKCLQKLCYHLVHNKVTLQKQFMIHNWFSIMIPKETYSWPRKHVKSKCFLLLKHIIARDKHKYIPVPKNYMKLIWFRNIYLPQQVKKTCVFVLQCKHIKFSQYKVWQTLSSCYFNIIQFYFLPIPLPMETVCTPHSSANL